MGATSALNVGAAAVSADTFAVVQNVATAAIATAPPSTRNLFAPEPTCASIITGSFKDILSDVVLYAQVSADG
jgi:hypothetical protein